MNESDRLHSMLDELGVEWEDGDAAYETEWSTPDGRRCSAMYWKPTFNVLISGCTPEQAIAATLGGSTLTAEQVRDVLLLHLPHREYYSIAQTDAWQAIADELNATLGSDRERELEDLVRDMRDALNPPCADTCPHCECKGCPDYDEPRAAIEQRIRDLEVI